MKVKILIAPLLLIIIVALLVWLVYPEYTNGVDGVKEKRQEYAKAKETFATISQKEANLMSLSSSLTDSGNKSKKDILYNYLPDGIKEEDIINNLNYIASDLGLSVSDLSVNQPDKKELPVSETVSLSGQPNPPAETLSATPTADKFKVDFSMIGSYDKIKSALAKVYKLERFNKILTLTISHIQNTETGTAELSGDNLQAAAVIEFDVLKKSNMAADPQNPAFDKNAFSWNTIQKITDSKNVNMLELKVDGSGRSNPFAL